MTRTIAIISDKGGVGKTTTALNLTACLALSGKKVLLLDLDPRGHATAGLADASARGVDPCNVLQHPERLGEIVFEAKYPNISLVPPCPTLADVEQSLGRDGENTYRLRDAVKRLAGAFEFLIVDCPPSLGLISRNALAAADGTILPLQCEPYAFERLGTLLNDISEFRAKVNPDLFLDGVLLTLLDPTDPSSLDVARQAAERKDCRVFRSVIPRDPAVVAASQEGLPLVESDIGSRAARAYVELAREVLGDA